MKLPDKNRRLALLMIVSQLLLICFTSYWLGGQYKEARLDLLGDLNTSYKKSQQRVIDSILVERYISPALGDSNVIDRDIPGIITDGKNVLRADSVIYKLHRDSVADKHISTNTVVTIQLADDTGDKEEEAMLKRIERDMLLRSIRLVVEHVDDSSSNQFMSLHSVTSNLDTALFISDFENTIVAEGIKVEPIWYSFPDSASSLGKNSDIVIGGWIKQLPVASIRNYQTFLLGQILPQILFALILVLLSALAFIFSYRSLRKQSQLNDIRSSFIANISHELKTPVSTVKLAIEAIKIFDLDKEKDLAAEYLDMASKEIKRLELLITKVLDNTIIEQDSSILHFEKTDLADIIKGAIESLYPKIQDSRAKIYFDPETKLFLDADPLYLQGVIINLIDNSLKYGNGNPELVIKVSESEHKAIFILSDNGPGIPDEYLSRVFDKFFRIPTSNIHNVKGYGLGLSFASLIVKLHGGSIRARNNETGCSFVIELPKKKVED